MAYLMLLSSLLPRHVVRNGWEYGDNQATRKETSMKDLYKRLLVEEEGQGITEYALILGLIAFGIWVVVRSTNIGTQLKDFFDSIGTSLTDCKSGDCGGK